MKTDYNYKILNQRWPVSHLAFLIFSALLTFIMSLTGNSENKVFSWGMFIMLFAQLEIFIYTGNLLFARVNFERNPGEITRIVLFRFIIFLLICMFFSIVLFIILQYAGLLIGGESLKNLIYNFFHNEIHGWFRSTISGFSIGAIIFIFLLWQTSLKREQKLREEKLIFQNETLRRQVNPHFLFNCLNTISSLVRTQPETAEIFIHDLSSVYRYILENGQEESVPLASELNFIKDYFSLHKIRDDGKINLEINIGDEGNFRIIPVSLQILIENAINHNVATRASPLCIRVFFDNHFIVVQNNLQEKDTIMKSTRTELKNLSERIRLVSGHPIIIEETASDFIVKLPLLT